MGEKIGVALEKKVLEIVLIAVWKPYSSSIVLLVLFQLNQQQSEKGCGREVNAIHLID